MAASSPLVTRFVILRFSPAESLFLSLLDATERTPLLLEWSMRFQPTGIWRVTHRIEGKRRQPWLHSKEKLQW